MRIACVLSLLVTLVTSATACGGSSSSDGDGGGRPSPTGTDGRTGQNDPTTDGAPSSNDGGACTPGEEKAPAGSTDGCYGVTEHVCGDVAAPYVCRDGAFRCPSGTVPSSECWCFGLGGPQDPSCTCTSSGWSCPSADGG